MDYKCLKCGAEFKIDVRDLVRCPECKAHDFDCMPLWKYRTQIKVEDRLNQPETAKVPTND